MARLKLLLLAFALAVPLAGCVVYQEGPPPRPGAAVWVPGHYTPYGVWVRGHWT